MGMMVIRTVFNKHLSIHTLRIAVCIDGPKRFAANARQLLGKEAIKQRHLEILGYEVVQVIVIVFVFNVGFVQSFSILLKCHDHILLANIIIIEQVISKLIESQTVHVLKV